MPRILIVAAFFAVFLGAVAALQCYDLGISKADFPYCKQLSSSYILHWRIESGYITFGIAADGKYGFIGLGISESGGMRGADMAILSKEESVTAGSAWKVGDYFSTDFTTPVLDPDNKQDWELMSVDAQMLSTYVTIRRKMDTCDSQYDVPVYRDTDQNIVWALGQKFAYHGANRGSSIIRLNPYNYNMTVVNATSVNGSTSVNVNAVTNTTESTYRIQLKEQDPSDLKPLYLRMPHYDVPSDRDTDYACVNLALPRSRKFHTIRYQGDLQTTGMNPSPVRYMVLYACSGMPSYPLNDPYTCYEMPDECSAFHAVWAPGSGNFSFPLEAGMPFGNTSVQYVALQVHYYNPKLVKNVVDNSGFILYYTSQLRPYDAGMLTLGSKSFSVPGGVSNYSIAPSVCPGNCTARVPSNLTLIASFFYMHEAGLAINTRHVRSGVELQPLGGKRYFDYDFQGFTTVLPGSRVLMPGDSLLTTCTFNTTGRKALTTFGPKTTDEMCFNFLLYYPRQTWLDSCTSDSKDNTTFATCGAASAIEAAVTNGTTLTDMLSSGRLVATGAWDMDFVPYTPPCEVVAPVPRPPPKTGPATASIVLTVLILLLIGIYVYNRYAKLEDPERLALLAQLQKELVSQVPGELGAPAAPAPAAPTTGIRPLAYEPARF